MEKPGATSTRVTTRRKATKRVSAKAGAMAKNVPPPPGLPARAASVAMPASISAAARAIVAVPGSLMMLQAAPSGPKGSVGEPSSTKSSGAELAAATDSMKRLANAPGSQRSWSHSPAMICVVPPAATTAVDAAVAVG